jgi:hypothetical protein
MEDEALRRTAARAELIAINVAGNVAGSNLW